MLLALIARDQGKIVDSGIMIVEINVDKSEGKGNGSKFNEEMGRKNCFIHTHTHPPIN